VVKGSMDWWAVGGFVCGGGERGRGSRSDVN
jgi:hypothetical protein